MSETVVVWFAAMTKPRQEWLASESLRRQGYDTLLLHYRDFRKRDKMSVNRAYFPRYVFVGLSREQGLYGASKAIGVATIVHGMDGPLRVPNEVVEELQTNGVCVNGEWHAPDASGYIHMEDEERERFKAGQEVKIISGPLQGLIATVSVDEGPQVRLWLNLFRGRVPVTVTPDILERAFGAHGGAFSHET